MPLAGGIYPNPYILTLENVTFAFAQTEPHTRRYSASPETYRTNRQFGEARRAGHVFLIRVRSATLQAMPMHKEPAHLLWPIRTVDTA